MTSIVPRDSALPDGVRSSARSDYWMLDQLPVGMLDGDFFVRFVSIFQELGTTLLEDADNIDNLVDLSVAPDVMVRWLGSWIGGGTIDPSLPHELQRRIVSSAAHTLTWRGSVARRRGTRRHHLGQHVGTVHRLDARERLRRTRA
jgi:phage tail-like protein